MNKKRVRNHNRKMKRRAVRKNRISAFFLTFCLIITLSFAISGFSSNAKTETGSETGKYYKSIMIEKGDTLWSIALRYMEAGDEDIVSYIEEVMRMNGLRNDRITEGMYLVIPYFS